MTYVVHIRDLDDLFHRANQEIITKLGGTSLIIRKSDFLKVDHLNILAQGWLDHYNIKILKDNKDWKSLEFLNEKHYTHFLLRWG